mgnify:CR=1 FL=1
MSRENLNCILVIGGGQAGAQALISLRQNGYEGALHLIAEEPFLPYQRPPLSKAYLKGEMAKERLAFKPQDWYESHNITLHLGVRADKIDRENHILHLQDGTELTYDALIIATGARPRPLKLEGADLKGVQDLRGLDDIDQLRPALKRGTRLVIIGAGYIGLEAAAAARSLGAEVTVLEMAERVLARVTSPVISTFFTQLHERQGVSIRTKVRTDCLMGKAGHVSGVKLSTGEELPADIVLVGIGVLPNQELAEAAGILCETGICVDEAGRTSDPDIFAAGDCTSRPLIHYDRRGRLESVHNAIEQGKCVAAALMEKPGPKLDVPWFWSDQYHIKLQIAGLSQGYENFIVRGDPTSERFAVFYFKAGKLLGVDAINAPPEFLVTKKLIISGSALAPEELQDTSLSMKEIAAKYAA